MEQTPLTWTTEKPTQPGWYWWRNNSHFDPDILKVDVLGDRFVIDTDLDVLDTPPGEWTGPLEPPT